MPKTTITSTDSIGPASVGTDEVIDSAITSAKFSGGAITPPSGITAPQLSSSLDLSGKTVTFSSPQISPHSPSAQAETNIFNIGLLGFKIAVSESLTVYNLVDGIVDEFHDESGVDTPENSNAAYDATNDLYSNPTTTMTVISETFTAQDVPTKARIVLFAEVADDLNTDIVASVTRDNSTFNAITLTDEGFQTGSSGLKIFSGSTPLTGTGSPQVALRWKVAGSSLSGTNKIHGVALQWA